MDCIVMLRREKAQVTASMMKSLYDRTSGLKQVYASNRLCHVVICGSTCDNARSTYSSFSLTGAK
jgi:hypothetical protein